jgi:hypothetical protein
LQSAYVHLIEGDQTEIEESKTQNPTTDQEVES